MHQAAVFVLCALVGWFVWQDFALLFVAWYSELEPPLTAWTKALLWVRAFAGITAAVVAITTL